MLPFVFFLLFLPFLSRFFFFMPFVCVFLCLCCIYCLFCCVCLSGTDIFDKEGWSTLSATKTLSICQSRLRRDKYNKKDSLRDQISKNPKSLTSLSKLKKKDWTKTYKPQTPLKSCYFVIVKNWTKLRNINNSSQFEQLNVQTPMTSWFVKL